jgi:hypothetical protein
MFETNLYVEFENLNYFLSNEFKNRWKFKYSINLISKFQDKLILSIKKQKHPTLELLRNYLVKQSYKAAIVDQFFEDIDITSLHPLVKCPL